MSGNGIALRRAATRVDIRFWLAAIVAVAFVGLALLSLGAPGPRIFPDELIYMDAASAVADGDKPSVRGGEYGYGPLYPILVAPLVALSNDREAAFPLIQLLNALSFALVAVPVYHLARRVVTAGWSLVAASLAVLIPSSVYASGVLTESLAYLMFACALLGLMRVVDEPTVNRQLVALLLVALAAATRTQFVLLAIALPVVLLFAHFVLPVRSRSPLRGLWPVGGAVAVAIVAFVGALATGRSPADLLGSYGVLWARPDAGALTRTLVDHAGLLVLYLAVLPVVVAPIELGRWWRSARSGSRGHAGMLALTVVVSCAMLVVVAVFASSVHVDDGLHDRSLFYLAPFGIIVLCGWLASGLARRSAALAVGAVIAVGLVAAIPYTAGGIVWETIAFEPWQFVERGNPAGTPFSGREAMLLFALAAVVAAVAVPRASRWVLVAFVGASFAFAGALAWGHAREGARSVDVRAFASGQSRGWVDASRAPSALLLTVPRGCRAEIDEASRRLTEFYSDAVAAGASVGRPDPLAPPGTALALAAGQDGWATLVRLDTGEPVRASAVIVRPGVTVRGSRLERGTRAPLVLWRVQGRRVDVRANDGAELIATGCAPR